MGVSGCGKSTVGAQLAQQLNAEFLEGDLLHPQRNIDLMAAGVALTDADRHDWLLALALRLQAAAAANRALVVSCSALKRSYRDLLRSASTDLAFVYLHGDAALLGARMGARVGHYMPASLLASQLATLEAPGADERAVTLDAALPAPQLVAQARVWLAAGAALASSTSSSTSPPEPSP